MKNKTIFGFKLNNLTQWLLYWAAVGTGLFILIFLVTSTLIGVSVHDKCLLAQGKYNEENCTDALIKVLEDENNSLRERNYAVWALGQIGDKKAKPVIENFYTGTISEREPYDKTLSQYEMEKALKLLNGGVNITHLVWSPSKLITHP